MKNLLSSIAILFSAVAAVAQPPPLRRGTELPVLTDKSEWYYQEEYHSLVWWTGKRWNLVASCDFVDFKMCNYFLFGYRRNGTDVFYAKFGRWVQSNVLCAVCEDSLEGFWVPNFVWMKSINGTDLVRQDMRFGGWSDQLHWQNVQGIRAICLPESFSGNEAVRMDELRNWGILGINGKWIIPPIYDGPFDFINGFADVTRYGRRIRINEKGETVE